MKAMHTRYEILRWLARLGACHDAVEFVKEAPRWLTPEMIWYEMASAACGSCIAARDYRCCEAGREWQCWAVDKVTGVRGVAFDQAERVHPTLLLRALARLVINREYTALDRLYYG
jgi:hypothetical protein